MRKTVRKKHHSVRRRNTGSSVGTYIVIFLIVVLLILLAKVAVRAFRSPFVLGIETSRLLVDENSSGDQKVNNDSQKDNNRGAQNPQVENSALVDCVGPDGRHLQTTFQACADLNKAFNKSNFNFTPLTTQLQQQDQAQVQVQEQDIRQETKTAALQKLQVKTENGKAEVNVSQNGTVLELKNENGKTDAVVKKADGTEIRLLSNDAVVKLNDALKEKEIKVEQTPDKEFVIKKGDVEAEAKVPISIDPTTKELSITTPAGLKTVTILPDQAVANLIASKQITNVTQQSTNFGASSSARIVLTELNNEPVFQVQGVLNKKILGIIPVSFAKTSFVSGTTGNVVKTDETVLNKILEAFSF